ncbi:hypothetical protein AB6C62_15005 [Vibrio splendidus]|uniref:hypothetical protein n=1 Tax=Vibrio splendidus TaxID=29497 RepID=UPI000C85010E|nr:hypothetical protein [Vibrio splendidus]PMO24527.1 hypothetical protein BCT15_05770 [Vibrio splendidus]
MSLLITDAGIAASIRAGELGISYKIAEISIGTEGYTPTADQINLRNEVQRKAITRGEVSALGRLHFETVWDGTEAFEGKELGYWLDDGTLFAVDSRDGEVITYKRKDTVVIEACELNLAASTIDNITVALLEAYSATEERSGVAMIATQSDAESGSDDGKIMTPLKVGKWWDKITSLAQTISGVWNFTGELKEKGGRVFSPNNRNISNSTTSTSSTIYASAKAIKTVKDLLTGHQNKFKTGRYSNTNVSNSWFNGNVGADTTIEYGYWYVWVTTTPSAITVTFELRLSSFSQAGNHDSGMSVEVEWQALNSAFSAAGVDGWSYSTRGTGMAYTSNGDSDQTAMPFRIIPNGTNKALQLYSPQLDFRDVNNNYPTVTSMILYGEVTLQNPHFK